MSFRAEWLDRGVVTATADDFASEAEAAAFVAEHVGETAVDDGWAWINEAWDPFQGYAEEVAT